MPGKFRVIDNYFAVLPHFWDLYFSFLFVAGQYIQVDYF